MISVQFTTGRTDWPWSDWLMAVCPAGCGGPSVVMLMSTSLLLYDARCLAGRTDFLRLDVPPWPEHNHIHLHVASLTACQLQHILAYNIHSAQSSRGLKLTPVDHFRISRIGISSAMLWTGLMRLVNRRCWHCRTRITTVNYCKQQQKLTKQFLAFKTMLKHAVQSTKVDSKSLRTES